MKKFTVRQSPLVSVITVNYRQAEVTCDLLRSLRALSYPNLEVIVVDNGMLENNSHLFGKHFPGVQVICSRENLGFAGGNNLGIRQATGDFILLVNNDTVVEDGMIERLLERFEHPGVGVVSPKIKYFHSPAVIQYAGFTKVNPLTGRNRAIGKGETDAGQHDEAKEVAYAHGAAMMLRRQVVERVGMMPEEFFLYYEELDWCERIRRAGYAIWYEPAATILHKESVSTGRNSPMKTEYLTRSRILFMRRNFTRWSLLRFYLFFFLVSFPISTLRWLLAGELDQFKAYCRGIARPFMPSDSSNVSPSFQVV
jgi:hypothetical protein